MVVTGPAAAEGVDPAALQEQLRNDHPDDYPGVEVTGSAPAAAAIAGRLLQTIFRLIERARADARDVVEEGGEEGQEEGREGASRAALALVLSPARSACSSRHL